MSSFRFVVRYWSSLLPDGFVPPDTGPCWVDYSVHPPSKLGLHNAMLVVHDREEVLESYGGYHECAVFAVDGTHCEKLTPATAERLFRALPHGDIKWLEIGTFVPPAHAAPESAPAETPPAPPVPGEQAPLFPHVHTPYDDVAPPPAHYFDADV